MSGCSGDCVGCHVDAVNAVLCPNIIDCCTIDGVEQAVGNSDVGGTVPTICADSAQVPDAACVDSDGANLDSGTACLHFGHPLGYTNPWVTQPGPVRYQAR